MEGISCGELGFDAAIAGLVSGNRECRLGYVDAQDRESQGGDEQSVLAGPAACIEYGSGESTFGC
jgi:hypothetical protein